MARIRSVHPALFTDEAWVSCTPIARVLFIGLWTDADDQGVFEWRPLQLRMRLLPGDDVPMDELLEELSRKGLLRSFCDAGKNYGVIKDFQKYQRPQKPRASFPLPSEFISFVTGQQDAPLDLFADASNTGRGESNQMEGRGEEEKSRGRGRPRGAPDTPLPDGFPDQEALEYAESRFLDAGVENTSVREAAKFRDHHLSKGKMFKDWRAAWRTWIGNAVEWSITRRGGPAEVHELVPLVQQRTWMREFLDAPQRWRRERGPAPDEPGCRVSAQVMAEFNYTPPQRAAR